MAQFRRLFFCLLKNIASNQMIMNALLLFLDGVDVKFLTIFFDP